MRSLHDFKHQKDYPHYPQITLQMFPQPARYFQQKKTVLQYCSLFTVMGKDHLCKGGTDHGPDIDVLKQNSGINIHP